MQDWTNVARDLAASDPIKAKAARVFLEKAAHTSCRPGARREERQGVIVALLQMLQGNSPRGVQALAIRLLGYIGTDKEARVLATLVKDATLVPDVKMAQERIRSVRF